MPPVFMGGAFVMKDSEEMASNAPSFTTRAFQAHAKTMERALKAPIKASIAHAQRDITRHFVKSHQMTCADQILAKTVEFV